MLAYVCVWLLHIDDDRVGRREICCVQLEAGICCCFVALSSEDDWRQYLAVCVWWRMI
jgi:hypothetical protein